jgi:hypothetical protein
MRFVYNLSLKNAARIIIQKRIHVGFMDLYNQSIKHGKDKKKTIEKTKPRVSLPLDTEERRPVDPGV